MTEAGLPATLCGMVTRSFGPVHMDPKKNSSWCVTEMRRRDGKPVGVITHRFANPDDAASFLEGK